MPTASRSPQPGPTDPLVALADRCVQCGLCLPTCPTYGLERNEAESPRGRIALARAWALDALDPTPTGDRHLDQCLGCRSCESVCPAGVQYGELLVTARARQRTRRGAGWRRRAIEFLVARPPLLRSLLSAYRVTYRFLPGRLRTLPPPPSHDSAPEMTTRGARVSVFVGCVADSYETGVRDALARCCQALGIELAVPAGQACCGTLHAHGGDVDGAQRLATRNRDAFASSATVLTLASGCHDAVAQALPGPRRVVDAIAFLADRIAEAPDALRWRPSQARVALHLPCTQRSVVRSAPALRRLLAAVPGLEVIELDAGYGCCGAAGLQMLDDPARAAEFRAPLLRQLESSGATRLLSANIGCRLHFAGGTAVPVQHPLEFLAELLDAPPSPPRAVGHT
ncbi:(Fe-S)-binding protein [Lysobacter sp. LF1]|uniref:Glycolate oxidase iron-sulfur subunit n=1 Tax=Lysobacter stagni TaxID=3045172 RepID=A0ABT6XEY9_9GAMM|nr:(Fe-S)-binding protein [Lysobacter sp. LF1]MDI9238717.1 (Fe-S)-binding protein [Lysobacter sp. LF1]